MRIKTEMKLQEIESKIKRCKKDRRCEFNCRNDRSMSLGIQSIISTQTRSDIFQLPLSEDINTGDLFTVEQ